jgi:uncharacterized protein YegL
MGTVGADLSVIEFSMGANVVVDWTPLSQFNPPVLTAKGLTDMGAGVLEAVRMVK